MKKTVFLNASRIDFDASLDFSVIEQVTEVTRYDDSQPEQILDRLVGQHIVITKEMPVSGELIAKFPDSVELICEAGTGYNNIDIAAARKKGIAVCNIPSYSTEAVAQLVITFLLGWSISLNRQLTMIQQQDFSNFSQAAQVAMFELGGKTLGLIGGSGAIGREVIKLSRALGMKVLVASRNPIRWDDPAVTSVSLDELLKCSDAVSIHCPLSDETRHLIDYEKLQLMKSSALLINTARGPIINELDLIAALQSGTIAAAALDVQDPEPPATDNPLFTMDNVFLTPHIGWKRLETRQRLLTVVAGNITSFLSGSPINVVN